MSFAETALLGAIAGCTIFLGLPIGRFEGLTTRARVGLSMLSAGILAFLFMDVARRASGSSKRTSTPTRTAMPRCGRSWACSRC